MADALAASIASSGNGLAPASAWFVVTLPEEYAFLNRIIGESPQPLLATKWGVLREASSFKIENGHAYDVLVINTEDTGPRRFWFDVGTLTSAPPSGMIQDRTRRRYFLDVSPCAFLLRQSQRRAKPVSWQLRNPPMTNPVSYSISVLNEWWF